MISPAQLHIMLQCLADVLRQRRYLRRALIPELEQLQQSAGEPFDSYLYEKIVRYYGLLTTAALAENYCRLRGRRLSGRERRWGAAIISMAARRRVSHGSVGRPRSRRRRRRRRQEAGSRS